MSSDDEQLDLDAVAGYVVYDRPASELPRILPDLTPMKVEVLAHVLAGFAYPGRGTFEALRKAEKQACRAAAAEALRIATDPTTGAR